MAMRKLKKYKPTRFMADGSKYDKAAADYAVNFIECLCHTKGTWAGKKFELIDWQEQIIRDLFGTLKPNGYRQFNTAYVEIPKKMGKSELAAAEAQQTVRIRHQGPNGTRATYDLKLLGYQIMSGSADGFMQLKVSGRQASDVVWSNADVAEQTQTTENEGE